MTLEILRTAMSEGTFKPFRLVMSNGKTYDIRKPEMAWLTRTSMVVGLDFDDTGVPAEFDRCLLDNITAIEPLSVAESAH